MYSKSLVILTSIIAASSMMSFNGVAKKTDSQPTINLTSSGNRVYAPIILNAPGNYRLIGVGAPINTNNNGMIVPVGAYSPISIVGTGEYNISLENVHIDVRACNNVHAFKVNGDANVNLTLLGDNVLKSDESTSAIDNGRGSLTITEESAGSSLDISESKGIDTQNIIINNGNVMTSGISGGNITINGGNVTSSNQQGENAIDGLDIEINGGEVTVSGKNGIHAEDIEINGGKVTAEGIADYGLYAENDITINGGNVVASGRDYGMLGLNIWIEGGKVRANGKLGGIYENKDVDISVVGGILKENGMRSNDEKCDDEYSADIDSNSEMEEDQ